MFTGGGTVVARYDYDPYGRSTTVLGTTPTDFNFTGLYRHSKSNLDLATYRAYDPDLGRWLSRDPIGNTDLITSVGAASGSSHLTSKAGALKLEIFPEYVGNGTNIVTYAGNRPCRYTDPTGLIRDDSPVIWTGPYPGPKNTRWCQLRRDGPVSCHIPRNPMLFSFCVSRAQAMMEIASLLENDVMFQRGCSELSSCLTNYYD